MIIVKFSYYGTYTIHDDDDDDVNFSLQPFK